MAVSFEDFAGTVPITLGGTVAVGDIYSAQNVIGVYMKGGSSGDIVPVKIQGKVKGVTTQTDAAWTIGDVVYYDTALSLFTKTASADCKLAGVAAAAKGSSTATGDVILIGPGSSVLGTAYLTGHVTVTDAKNIVLASTTGTKIGTAVTQKLGFWNATPVVQPASANQAALSLASITGTDSVSSAAVTSNFTAIQTLVNQLRSDLVAAGVIKGSA